MADKLLQRIEDICTPYPIPGPSISIGFARFPKSGSDPDSIYRSAKRYGKDRVDAAAPGGCEATDFPFHKK